MKINRAMSKLPYVASGGIIIYLLLYFGHFCGFMKCRLFKQHCCSFYGSPLLGLDSNGVKSLCITSRKHLECHGGYTL